MFTIASRPLSWFSPRVIRTVAEQPRHAGGRAVDAAVAAHHLGRRCGSRRCRKPPPGRCRPAPGASRPPAGRRRPGAAAGRRRGGRPPCRRRVLQEIGHQRVGADAAVLLPVHHQRVAARHRHAPRAQYSRLSRAVITCCARGQRQAAPGQHQHRLVDVVDRAVAAGGVGGGGDADVALRLQPPDLAAAAERRFRRRRGPRPAACAAAGAPVPRGPVARHQPVGVHRRRRRAPPARCRGRSPPAPPGATRCRRSAVTSTGPPRDRSMPCAGGRSRRAAPPARAPARTAASGAASPHSGPPSSTAWARPVNTTTAPRSRQAEALRFQGAEGALRGDRRVAAGAARLHVHRAPPRCAASCRCRGGW